MRDNFTNNMAHMTYGIYVLTTRFEEAINGMIASWVCQASFDPPMIMAAVHPNRYSHELLEKSGHFALHILAQKQKDFLGRFKGPDPGEKFKSIAWRDGITGCPILSDCIGCLECRIVRQLAPGNHSLFVGEVVSAVFNGQGVPLTTLDYEGCYTGRV